MNLIQIKEQIDQNLSQQKSIFADIPVNSESISFFLEELPAAIKPTSNNTTITLTDSDSLFATTTFPSNWELSNVPMGELTNGILTFELTQVDDIPQISLGIKGDLFYGVMEQPLKIVGTLSDNNSWAMDLQVSGEELPSLLDIAQWTGGTQDIIDNLNVLNSNGSMPEITIDDVHFTLNLSTQEIVYIGVYGSMNWGKIPLRIHLLFMPDLSIIAHLADDISIDVKELFEMLALNPPEISSVKIADLALSAHLASQSYSASVTLDGDWDLAIGDKKISISKADISLLHEFGNTEASVSGELILGEFSFYAQSQFSTVDNSLRLIAEARSDSNIHFGDLVSLVSQILPTPLTLPNHIPSLGFSDLRFMLLPTTGEFSLAGALSEPWTIPVGINDLTIHDVSLSINQSKSDNNQKITTGVIEGAINIGNSDIDIAYNFPGDFVLSGNISAISLSLLLQEFCGGDVVRDLPLPASLLETELRDVTFTIAPQQKQLSFAAETALGQAEIIISQGTDGKWGFSIGFVPPSSWNFAALDPALAVLNDLDFSDSTLIVSSSDDKSLVLTTISLPQGNVAVQKGLNFFASLDTSALGLKEVLPGFELDHLQVYAAIGNNPQNLEISAAIEGEFHIDQSTSFGDITFRLKPSPGDFEVALLGTVVTTIDDSPLIFTGGLVVTAPPPAAGLEATMLGTWDNPFGVQNLSISNVGLDLKIPPLSIGIAGGLQIGNFEGRAAVSLNSANPTPCPLPARP